MRVGKYDYPDDLFADTRMSFGDHIEELRFYLLRAIYGLLICLVLGFVLDGIGTAFDWPIGVGRPAMDVITEPVESQVTEFYERRRQALEDKLATDATEDPQEPINQTYTLKAELKTATLAPYLRDDVEIPEAIPIEMSVRTAEVYNVGRKGELAMGMNKQLTTLSVQEGFVVYFKVSLLCGFVIASPWIFWQVWGFVGAGLYPHEKRYMYRYLPFSIGLFLGGVLMCQFIVLPRAVGALLAFNEWLNLDPDIRLNEWLGFAIILPLVFGLSFQTPLFMLFFERIGMFGVDDYKKRWRAAVMILAIFAALLTPTPDAVTMMWLFLPMFGLYALGIWLCQVLPKPQEDFDTEDDEDIAV